MTDEQITIFARSIMKSERERFGNWPPLEDMKEFVRKAWEEAKSGSPAQATP